MKTAAILAAFASLLAFTSAAPVADVEERALPMFKLKAVSSDARFNNKCLTTYHTGAGFSDATFSACQGAPNWFQNGTRVQTNTFGTQNPPAGLVAEVGISYNDWYPVTVGPAYGPGSANFKYSAADGYTVHYFSNTYNSFIACDWSHPDLTPQLFLLARDADAVHISANCNFIKLVKA